MRYFHCVLSERERDNILIGLAYRLDFLRQQNLPTNHLEGVRQYLRALTPLKQDVVQDDQ